MLLADLSTMLLASIPSPDRGVWHLGPVPIRAYALCIIVGIIVAIWWGERRFVARGGQPGTVIDVAVWAVPFGLIGGRLYHVLTDWSTYFGEGANPVNALKIWQGGLGIWGAIALGGVGAWIGCRRRGVPLPFLADAVAPGIAVAQAIGRLGNWFNQELFGRVTTLPWGLEIYERVNPGTGRVDSLTGVAISSVPEKIVHPTFLYELLWNLGVAALVVWADRRFRLGHGRAFAVYVAGYTAGRFWIELLRDDPATEVFGVRINAIMSVLVFAGAVVYLFLAPRGRELPPGASEPGTGDTETGTGDTETGGPAATGGEAPTDVKMSSNGEDPPDSKAGSGSKAPSDREVSPDSDAPSGSEAPSGSKALSGDGEPAMADRPARSEPPGEPDGVPTDAERR
jgi:prolipoprotein diacylglyceryl transferase